jgi:hypothetical protein
MNKTSNDTDKNLRVNKTNLMVTTALSLAAGYGGYRYMIGKSPMMMAAGAIGGFAATHIALSMMFGIPYKIYQGNRDISNKPLKH